MRNRQNLLRNKSLTFWGHLTLGRKIGISFVGGIYPCCVNASYSEEDPTIILNDIYQHWKNVSDRDILQAFKETTISFEVNLQDISNIIGFDLNR